MSGLDHEFQEGDILFGIPTQATIDIINAFSKKFPNAYCTVDPYIHTFIGFLDTNILGIQRLYRYGECPDSLNKAANDPRVNNFRRYIEAHAKYDPRYIFNNTSPANTLQYSLRVKRACKAWVEWTVRSEQPTGHIHVLLDGVNLQRVFSPAQQDVFFRAELKTLFKVSLSDPKKFDEKIIFWKDGKRVSPPWKDENTKSLWLEYEAHLKTKQENNSTLTPQEQHDVKNKIVANNSNGEITKEVVSTAGLFSQREHKFVINRTAEKRSIQFSPRMSKM